MQLISMLSNTHKGKHINDPFRKLSISRYFPLIYILSIVCSDRLRYYLPDLKKRGITKIGLVLNCEPEAAKRLVDLVDLQCDESDGKGITLMVDPMGRAGRAFGVKTGWRPEDTEMSPYVKLFGMLWGLGVSDGI